jgi:hypothetical protein
VTRELGCRRTNEAEYHPCTHAASELDLSDPIEYGVSLALHALAFVSGVAAVVMAIVNRDEAPLLILAGSASIAALALGARVVIARRALTRPVIGDGGVSARLCK